MEILGSIGVLLGLVAIIYFSVKGLNIIVAAPLAAILVALLNNMNILDAMLGKEPGSFMAAFGGYIISFFAVFLLGSILAKFMEESGATVSIAETILKKIGSDRPYPVLVAIFIITTILTYGGISLFVVMFAVIPLARSLFKELDIAWNLITIPLWLGAATITMTLLPGTPAIQNVIPSQYLGTPLTALAVPSLVASVACVAFGLYYMKRSLDKSLANNETYSTYVKDEVVTETKQNLPSFVSSILPLIVLVVMAITGSVFGNEFIKKNIIYIALATAVVLSYLLFRKYIDDNLKTLNLGATGSVMPIIATASAVAFGAVIMMAPGFTLFSDLIISIPGNPVFSLSFLTAIMSGITGSSSGALGIVIPNFAQHYLDAGLHPELIHRVSSVAAGVLTAVPQSGALITFWALTGLTLKNSYKFGFIIVGVGSFISLVIVIALGLMMY